MNISNVLSNKFLDKILLYQRIVQSEVRKPLGKHYKIWLISKPQTMFSILNHDNEP